MVMNNLSDTIRAAIRAETAVQAMGFPGCTNYRGAKARADDAWSKFDDALEEYVQERITARIEHE